MIAQGFLPPISQPPHDPKWWLLDASTGWREAELTNLEEPFGQPALALVVDPQSGRSLDERAGSFGGLTVPGNVALGPEENVYLLDPQSLHLKHFDRCECRFKIVPCFGGSGPGPRQLDDPHGIAIRSGNLYVCDTGNRRIGVFALSGFVLRGFWKPSPSATPENEWQPHGIAFDRYGRAFVTDPANGCVHIFNRFGVWEKCLRGLGNVTHVAIDCDDRIILLTSGADPPVQVVDADGRRLEVPSRPEALAGRFLDLPFEVDALGNLHLAALCDDGARTKPERPSCDCACHDVTWEPQALETRGVFNVHGEPVEPAEASPVQYHDKGEYFTSALDSGSYRCRWHRIELCGDLPEGTRIRVATFTAETEQPFRLVKPQPTGGKIDPEGAWSPWQTATQMSDGRWDCLVRSGGGRFLWLWLRLEGNCATTPRLRQVRVEFPRISLRRYLPAVFGEEPVSADFTDRFLAVFDTTLRSVERTIDEQARYFDPTSAPADSASPEEIDFLSWLASWIGLTLERQLPEAKRREIVKAASTCYHLRGTRLSLWRQLLIYLGMEGAAECCTQPEPRTRCVPLPLNCAPPSRPDPRWQPPPLILEHFRLRRWLFLGAGRLGDEAVLWGQRIVNRSQLDTNGQLGVTQLTTTPDPLRDPFHVYAHRFSVFVPACHQESPRHRQALENLVGAWTPAHVQPHIEYVHPRFRIGVQSMIGLDSVVGRYPRGVELGETRLGPASVLEEPPHRRGGPTMAIGKDAWIGSTTQLD